MAQLTTNRLIFHACLLLALIGYLIWSKVPITQLFVSIVIAIMFDGVYLTAVVIKNFKPSPKHMSLEGKRVIITGGNSGIGFQLAKQLLLSGAQHIVLVARNQSRLETCKKDLDALKSHSQTVSFLALDLTSDSEKVINNVKRLCASIGGIDILINSAGYSLPGEFQALHIDSFKKMIDVNYLGSVYITRAVVPLMIEQRFGQIVFLSSMVGQLSVYGFTAYGPSKYAIRGFAECLYSELKPYDVGVSVAFPPDTATPGFENENKMKPKITHKISEQGGLWNSTEVAQIIKSGIERRKFMIGFGTDGFFLNALTCGGAPPSSVLEFWTQCLLSPILRVYILFMQNGFSNLVEDEIAKK